MIAILMLVAVVGAIVYSSRKGRSAYTVSVRSGTPGDVLTFNVRDMTAETKSASTGKVVESFDLRRVGDGRWELASVDDEIAEPRTWVPCDESATTAIEEKHQRYNGP